MDGGRKKKKRKKGKRKRSIFGRGRARLSYEDAFFTGSLSLSLSLSPCPPPSRALSFPLPRAPLPFFFGTCSQPPAEKSAPWPFDGCVKTRAQLFASSISHGVKEGRRGQRWCSLPIPQGYSPALLLLTVIFYWVYDVINLIASSTHRPNRDASETDGIYLASREFSNSLQVHSPELRKFFGLLFFLRFVLGTIFRGSSRNVNLSVVTCPVQWIYKGKMNLKYFQAVKRRR